MPSTAAFNADVLIRLYDDQPIAVDSLGGTNELKMMAARYSVETGRTADEAGLLAALIDLRKKGKLPRKTDRPIKKATVETWPPYSELKRSVSGYAWYEVKLPHQIDFNVIMYAIYVQTAVYGKAAPLSRLEAFEMVKYWVPMGYVFNGGVYDEVEKEDLIIPEQVTRRLFPELATCVKDS